MGRPAPRLTPEERESRADTACAQFQLVTSAFEQFPDAFSAMEHRAIKILSSCRVPTDDYQENWNTWVASLYELAHLAADRVSENNTKEGGNK